MPASATPHAEPCEGSYAYLGQSRSCDGSCAPAKIRPEAAEPDAKEKRSSKTPSEASSASFSISLMRRLTRLNTSAGQAKEACISVGKGSAAARPRWGGKQASWPSDIRQ